MKKITNLKAKLSAHCDYFTDDLAPGSSSALLGYIRADHDGYRWWRSNWPANDDLFTDALREEFDAVYDAFLRSFKDLRALGKWIASAGLGYEDYGYGDRGYRDAYYDGEHGYYLFRMNVDRGDYNLYLHCFSKAALKGGK